MCTPLLRLKRSPTARSLLKLRFDNRSATRTSANCNTPPAEGYYNSGYDYKFSEIILNQTNMTSLREVTIKF